MQAFLGSKLDFNEVVLAARVPLLFFNYKVTGVVLEKVRHRLS